MKIVNEHGVEIEYPEKRADEIIVNDVIVLKHGYRLVVVQVVKYSDHVILVVEHDPTENEYHGGNDLHMEKYPNDKIIPVEPK